MYHVVGCGSCGHLWIRDEEPASATCPRCQRRFQADALRALASAASVEAAREARTQLLADRSEHGSVVAGYAETERATGERAISGAEVLEAHGIDPEATKARRRQSAKRGSPREQILEIVGELDNPTRQVVTACAAERDLSADRVESVLDRLNRDGLLVRDGDRYRRV